MSNSMTEHFTHPGHKLVQIESNEEYLCRSCKTLGSGKTFRCTSCNDFNLHEFCGKCPEQLWTFMHPLHRLSLVVRTAYDIQTNYRTCDVCEDDIEGYFYRCQDCDFDLHPVCTELPENLRHALHPDHSLVLQKSKKDGPCCVCKGVCKSWRYRCGECDGFDIHLDCVPVVVASPTTTRNIQFAPPYNLPMRPQQPLHVGWVPPGYSSPYYNMYNSGFVNNQACMYNPVHLHHSGYAQAYIMYNPTFSMYNSYGGVPCGAPIGSDPYNKYDYQNQDHHAGSSNEMQNSANNNYHEGVGPNRKKSRLKRMFKLVGTLSVGVLSSVIFGVAFPGLR